MWKGKTDQGLTPFSASVRISLLDHAKDPSLSKVLTGSGASQKAHSSCVSPKHPVCAACVLEGAWAAHIPLFCGPPCGPFETHQCAAVAHWLETAARKRSGEQEKRTRTCLLIHFSSPK